MFKLLFFSDIHLDAVTAGKPRRKEILAFLERIYYLANQEQVDLVAFCGDAFDQGGVSDALHCSELTKRFLSFPRVTSAPAFVAIPGNHDVIDVDDYFMDMPVTTLTPVRAACHHLPREHADKIHILDRPLTRLVKPGLAVLGLPYVSRVHAGRLPVWEPHAYNVAKQHVQDGAKLVVIGHRVIPTARMSSESAEMARGQDQIFPAAQVAELKPSIVVNGHYHASQFVCFDGLDIHIPGSPVRFTFGEADDENKGALLAVI